jgi:pimeloyl-ACP methyl ester carboxylesterase
MIPLWLDPAWRAAPRSTIVLAHGAVVNGWEMGTLRRRLRKLGYEVRQFHYRSMSLGLDENVERLRDFIAATEGDIVHVIGHSMGGVLARHVFEKMPDPRPGRLVAVGSPLTDCWVGRRFGRLHGPFGRCLTGRTVQDHLSRPAEPLWRGARDFGVLAGTFPLGIGRLFPELPAPSDGVVLLEETRLRGIRDHVTCRLNHFGMLFSRRCCRQMARFLATGKFGPADGNSCGGQ